MGGDLKMKLTIREWRKLKEVSQEKMAQKLGVHANTYAAWEKNAARIPVDKAFAIALIFDVTIDSIIFDAK